MDLFDTPPWTPPPPPDPPAHQPSRHPIFLAYKTWDAENPAFYPLFTRFSLQMAGTGRRHLGVALIWERIRWETMLQTEGDDYKLNNNFKCLYARRFMRDYPNYEGFFRTRALISIGTIDEVDL